MSMKPGFIGLGIMGRPMALNLMKHGHQMGVYARRPESAALTMQHINALMGRGEGRNDLSALIKVV